MKTGIQLISEERATGYRKLKECNFAKDFSKINAGIEYAYKYDSELKTELLTKAGALIAAEIDRLQSTLKFDEYILITS